MRHHVTLSIIGLERAADLAYYRAKLLQEETVEAGGNFVVGADRARILAAMDHWARTPFDENAARERGGSSFGSGDACDRTVDAILRLNAVEAS